MDPVSLSESDVCSHVVSFGIDIYPPIEIPKERTRLNMFYEAARERWGHLYERLVASDIEFKISKEFRRVGQATGPSCSADTLVLTNRGPVFVFPLELPDPVGESGLKDRFIEDFRQVKDLFLQSVPDRKIMRLGLVRDLLFATGTTFYRSVLTDKEHFVKAELEGGKTQLTYRDSRFNFRIVLEPVEIMESTRLPIGTKIDQRQGYGLRVQLDVNNHEIRPLEDADIALILERAGGLWPEELLQYLHGRSSS